MISDDELRQLKKALSEIEAIAESGDTPSGLLYVRSVWQHHSHFSKESHEIQLAKMHIPTLQAGSREVYTTLFKIAGYIPSPLETHHLIGQLVDYAENGSGLARNELGCFYDSGNWVAQDVLVARRWFQLAVLKKYPYAYAWLSNYAMHVRGSAAEALQWYQKAVDDGISYYEQFLQSYGQMFKRNNTDTNFKKHCLAKLHALDAFNTTATIENYIQRLTELAKQNQLRAIGLLAEAYDNCLGVELNPDRASAYYRQGAEIGDAEMQFTWGRRALAGYDKKVGAAAAHAWIQKSADQGYSPAIRFIAGE